MSRRILLILIIVLVLAAVGYGFLPGSVLVETAVVSRGPLAVTLVEEGETRVKERFVIAATVDGMVCRIDLDVGDPVEAGQLLAYLEPLPPTVLDPRSRAEARARVATAEAQLQAAWEQAQAAEADAEYAAQELARLERLFQAGNLSQGQLDQARAGFRRSSARARAASFTVQEARFVLQAAEAVLGVSAADEPTETPEQVPIRSPVSGQVLAVQQESECVATRGQPLLEVGDPRELEVAVDVLSADAVRIEPGMRVWLERWGGEQALQGRVRTVEPTGFTRVSALGVEEQRVLVIVDIVSPPENWARLGDGYRVEARFVLWEGEAVLQIPLGALFREGEDWASFLVAEDTARLRNVVPGHQGTQNVQILEGLAEGETVVVHPPGTLAGGVAVSPR